MGPFLSGLGEEKEKKRDRQKEISSEFSTKTISQELASGRGYVQTVKPEMSSPHLNGGAFLWFLLFSFCFLFLAVNTQDCSSLNPCATGCCNQGGYCGIGDEYCGTDCVASCDYEPECSATKPCAKGCCNEYGYCGLGPDCKF